MPKTTFFKLLRLAIITLFETLCIEEQSSYFFISQFRDHPICIVTNQKLCASGLRSAHLNVI